MTKDEALTLKALKYAASKGYGSIVRKMKIAPFVIKEVLAQPEQELHKGCARSHPHENMDSDCELRTEIARLRNQMAQPEERNFCPRCGKRLASGFVEISIHTCTPPKETT